jgi:hypothetical protein
MRPSWEYVTRCAGDENGEVEQRSMDVVHDEMMEQTYSNPHSSCFIRYDLGSIVFIITVDILLPRIEFVESFHRCSFCSSAFSRNHQRLHEMVR